MHFNLLSSVTKLIPISLASSQRHGGSIRPIIFSHRKRHYNNVTTERGGSVVTHETRIREVPGSNPGATNLIGVFFVVFLNHQGKCWVGFSLPRSIWPLFIYHKIKSVKLTNETLTTHNNRNTQPCSTHPARWLRGNTRDSHSGDPRFKSRGRPTWLRFLVVSSI